MIVFLDTNLVLDVMLANSDFYDESNAVLSYCDKGYDFYISAASCTDIFYIAKRTLHDMEATKAVMRNLLTTVSVAGVDEVCIRNALESDWSDFEDSVQHEVAQQIKADIIITRNQQDYKHSVVRIMSPAEFLAFVEQNKIIN
ncbi:PIN domain-containing protein [uncultured Treponema sp.]|uniref:PIN domain-containing protein n=1 Tax=uncultured Treponema sp. TaxID=162155 RepID=UPI0025D491BD|nr:PIN domain-containing protein [uncultured Treponema sp.]